MKPTTQSRFRQVDSTSALAKFLSHHDDEDHSGFITRIDRSPVASKITTFLTALALNAIILMFVACVMMFSFFSEFFAMNPLPFCSRMVAWTVQNAVISGAILILLSSTSIPFFLGECRLRLSYGFRPAELVIRRAPPPSLALSAFSRDGIPREQAHVEHQWRAAIRAINPRLLYSTTSALLSPDYWTLEYSAVRDALKQIAAGELREDELEFSVWKQAVDGVWAVCELWRMHEIMSDQQEVAMFKGFLTQAGKEDLLRIWEGMACVEKGTKTEVTPQAYQAMVNRFAQEGLDYETVWSQISDRT